MQRIDVVRTLASRCRLSHHEALFVVGWFVESTSTEELSDLLSALELEPVTRMWGDHLELYRERWAARPPVQP